ncbi:DNA (cytosine-5-)-methyltransferase [Agreia sp. Leaf283]|uniref:DNA (cytosine-5-)-methyltransferase n=1 Tax=Agreia sp. Leaf283 TaxID=1736321 RepID=UPI0006FCC19B|nr:DNA (cytosine-5-)-methyltransferase [Agreia sp. Leaf283]KQP57185.1 cytosine methyltransferase [Agreia sp. Leaf283]
MTSAPSASDRVTRIVNLHGTKSVAAALGCSTRTLERWASGETTPPPFVANAIDSIYGPVSAAPTEPGKARFVDLFAGIGGLRQGVENAGGTCVFTSEWDRHAVATYSANFDAGHEIRGDITSIGVSEIPDHDLLTAGFPCQPFSLAGVSKKNSLGRQHGFLDKTQGTLFFDVARIIKEKRPSAFILENVKNLLSHDQGRTFQVIQEVLMKELNYHVSYRVIDSSPWVPQKRQRVIILGTLNETSFDWANVASAAAGPKLGSILHSELDPIESRDARYVDMSTGLALPKYTLSDKLWSYLQGYAKKHKDAGHGFGFGLVDATSVTRTLSARYHKDGSEILVDQGDGVNPRRLTPRECARLMGFDDSFAIPVSDTQAYRQFGNSVVVPVITQVASELFRAIRDAPTEQAA